MPAVLPMSALIVLLSSTSTELRNRSICVLPLNAPFVPRSVMFDWIAWAGPGPNPDAIAEICGCGFSPADFCVNDPKSEDGLIGSRPAPWIVS